MRGTVWPSSRALSTSCSDHSSWATFGKCHTGDLWVIYLLWCSQYSIITNQRPSLLLPRVDRCVFGIKRTWEHNYDSNRPGGYPIWPRGSGRVSRNRVGLEKSERSVLPGVLGWFDCQLSENDTSRLLCSWREARIPNQNHSRGQAGPRLWILMNSLWGLPVNNRTLSHTGMSSLYICCPVTSQKPCFSIAASIEDSMLIHVLMIKSFWTQSPSLKPNNGLLWASIIHSHQTELYLTRCMPQ